MLYGDFYYLCDIKKQLHFIYIMKTQSGIYLTALLLAGALTTSCSRQAPEPLPYPNDGVLTPHQQEAVGRMPRVVVMTDAEVDDRCSMVPKAIRATSVTDGAASPGLPSNSMPMSRFIRTSRYTIPTTPLPTICAV